MRLGFSFEKHVSLTPLSEVHFFGAFKINADFRNVIRAVELLKDSSISERMRVNAALKLLLKPMAFRRARLLSFGGRTALLNRIFKVLNPDSGEKKETTGTKRVLSLIKDGGLIYGAFLQAYGLDLNKKGLDWRTFCSLLCCIPEGTALFNVMKNRTENTEITQDIDDGLEILFNKLSGGETNG
ncbi:MAG: bacteriophage Gp15 family protein [Oscillospiraceae bacterium]|nr:bacteriophage Gp15 family protein [Oscillospiraceae bacterium]